MAVKPLSPQQRSALERATDRYQRDLENDEEARRYLEEERGLTFPTIGRFRLGVVRRPINDSHRRFRNRISIPNICASGAVVGIKYRLIEFGDKVIDDDEGAEVETAQPDDAPKPKKVLKYDQEAGAPLRLFNLQALNYAGSKLWVTEGECDTLALEDIGLPSIGIPGASHWGKSHAYRARILEGLQVTLMRDNDVAGQRLADAMKEVDGLVVRDCKPWNDVTDYLLNEGPEALYARATGLDTET